MRWSILIILLLLTFSSTFAQKGKIKRAFQEYERSNYKKAEILFEEVILKRDGILYKTTLADIYMKTRQWQKAEAMYAELVDWSVPNENRLIVPYCFAMSQNGKCDVAKTFILEYKDIVPDDNDADIIIQFCDDKTKLWKNICEDCYKIDTVSFNSKGNDFGTVLYKDGFIFTSDREGLAQMSWYELSVFYQLYYVQRDTIDKQNYQYSSIQNFKPDYLKSKRSNSSICFSSDYQDAYVAHLRFVFDSDDERIGLFEHRNKFDDKTSSNRLPYTFKDYSVANPFITSDGDRLYFASDMVGGFGGYDIYYSERMEDENWSPPINLGPTINTSDNEVFPFIHEATSTFYFSSDKYLGMGGYDLYFSIIDENTFKSPKNMGEPFNSDGNEYSFWMNKDGDFGYFASDKKGGKGGMDIYSFIKKK